MPKASSHAHSRTSACALPPLRHIPSSMRPLQRGGGREGLRACAQRLRSEESASAKRTQANV
eukprot:8341092-Alexandrium_andersonii.AAC.1